MEITVSLPDEIVQQIRKLPNMDEFVATLVKDALKSRPEEPASSDSGTDIQQEKSGSDEFYGIFAAKDRGAVKRIAEDKEIYYDL